VLRTALQAVYQQTARTTDEKGELTRKALALLGWDPTLVQEAVATLLGTVTYTAALTALPDTVAFPLDIPVRYNAIEQELLFIGPMTAKQLGQLVPLSADAGYQAAVRALHDAPRTFVTTRMKAIRIPVFAAPLHELPADYPMPKALVGKVFFDLSKHTLNSRGYLSEDDEHALT